MNSNWTSSTCEPLTWVGRVPVYASTVLAAAHGVTMILTAMAMAIGGSNLALNGLLSPLLFWSEDVLRHGRIWEIFTYAFVNEPGIWVVVQLVLLAMFGSEVEKFIGRRAFLWTYGLLLVATPVFLILLSFAGVGVGYPYFGSGSLHFAVFLAFALIYPRAEIFFGVQARWIALGLVAINSLSYLAYGGVLNLGVLWWNCILVVLIMKYQGVGTFSFPSFPKLPSRAQQHSKKHLRVVREEEMEVEVHDSIDPILEKISKHGIASLSRSERDRLEKARAVLLEKERPQ